MTSLVTLLLWCVLQVTIVALLAAVVYFVIKRCSVVRRSVLLTGLTWLLFDRHYAQPLAVVEARAINGDDFTSSSAGCP
ncbi:MAG: hypothetical protein R3B91_01715 [Planctomycetaceae bacterium]